MISDILKLKNLLRNPERILRRVHVIMCRAALAWNLIAFCGCATTRVVQIEKKTSYNSAGMVDALNSLRNEINAKYGFRNGAPRINLGPCGRFARDFRDRWNACFQDQINIAFIMSNKEASNCYHVLVKLADGRYFDGGNGVMTEKFLTALFPDGHIEEMKQFNFELLNKRSYGLGRSYPECPNYSDEFTRQAIDKWLVQIRPTAPRAQN
jgi:hypothetical protein